MPQNYLDEVKLPKIKLPKIKPIKVTRIHSTKMGDRTLTPAQKRKLKEKAGFRCQKCGRKLDPRLLQIHHKKSVASHKSPCGVDIPVFSMGKKIKPKYERKSNLQVLCDFCHDKTKGKKKSKSVEGIPAFRF